MLDVAPALPTGIIFSAANRLDAFVFIPDKRATFLHVIKSATLDCTVTLRLI